MIFTNEELEKMNCYRAKTEIRNEIYEACALFEFLEHEGKIHGNGHHMRQAVAKFAQDLMENCWISDKSQTHEEKEE